MRKVNCETHMTVLAAGVAARLHLDAKRVTATYAPSTYAEAPPYLRNESAEVMVMVKENPKEPNQVYGVRAMASWIENMELNEAADRIANQCAEWRQEIA